MNTCVCCGEQIPEGRQVCLYCQTSGYEIQIDRVTAKQYMNLRAHLHRAIDKILGRDYYNLGMDVYNTDRIALIDIMNAYENMKKELKSYRRSFIFFVILSVIDVIILCSLLYIAK